MGLTECHSGLLSLSWDLWESFVQNGGTICRLQEQELLRLYAASVPAEVPGHNGLPESLQLFPQSGCPLASEYSLGSSACLRQLCASLRRHNLYERQMSNS